MTGSLEYVKETNPLVLSFLLNEPLDVSTKLLNDRVIRVVCATLISVYDESSNSIREVAAVVACGTFVDVLLSGSVGKKPEGFPPNGAARRWEGKRC